MTAATRPFTVIVASVDAPREPWMEYVKARGRATAIKAALRQAYDVEETDEYQEDLMIYHCFEGHLKDIA